MKAGESRTINGSEIPHVNEIRDLAGNIILLMQAHSERLNILDLNLAVNHLSIAFSRVIVEMARQMEVPQPMPWRIRAISEQIGKNAQELHRLIAAGMQ